MKIRSSKPIPESFRSGAGRFPGPNPQHLARLAILCSLLLAGVSPGFASPAAESKSPSPEPAFAVGEGGAEDSEAPDLPRERIRWFSSDRVGPDGKPVPGARLRALAQIDDNIRKGLLEPAPLAIPGTTWAQLGPNPIGVANHYAGRISAIAVDPTNANVVYAGGASGGVWKTTDAGLTWKPLTDFQASLATGSLAIAPSAPQTIFVGTGEANESCDSYFGAGILKSTDSGATWTQLAAATFANQSIAKIVIHPTNPLMVWAASTTGAAGFACGGVGATTGVYKSIDGGSTWIRNSTGAAMDLVIDPTNPINLYAAFDVGGAASPVRKSTDSGDTWTTLAGGLPVTDVGRSDLAIHPTTAGLVYVSVETNSTSQHKGIWKSIDAGATWTALASIPPSLCSSQCWYDQYVDFAPNGDLYAAGFGLYRSTDLGGGWTSLAIGHVDHHVISFAKTNGDAWEGNDGGIYRSTNGGASWVDKNTGLVAAQSYPGGAVHPSR